MIMSLNVDGALHDVSASSKIDLTKLYIKPYWNVINGKFANTTYDSWTDTFAYPCFYLIYWWGYDYSSSGLGPRTDYDMRMEAPQYIEIPQDGSSVVVDKNDLKHSGKTRLTVTKTSLTMTRVVRGYDIEGINYIAIGLMP